MTDADKPGTTPADVLARLEAVEAALRAFAEDALSYTLTANGLGDMPTGPWHRLLAALDAPTGDTPAAADGGAGRPSWMPGPGKARAFTPTIDTTDVGSAIFNAPAPPAGELPARVAQRLRSVAARIEDSHASLTVVQCAQDLEDAAASLPPALPADAAETLRSDAALLEVDATYLRTQNLVGTASDMEGIAARLRALAEAVSP